MNLQRNLIKEKGLRITPARIVVLKILEDSLTPLDTNAIYKEVLKHHVDADQATIYRIIESFYDNELIARFQFQERKFVYEAIRPEHHHAICEDCGKIDDISNCSIKRVEKRIEQSKGFKVKSHSLEFFGTCSECQTK